MVVLCQVFGCPWNNKRGVCLRKAAVLLNANGMCKWIYDENGNVKPYWQEELEGTKDDIEGQ